jgi:hypothetical protein
MYYVGSCLFPMVYLTFGIALGQMNTIQKNNITSFILRFTSNGQDQTYNNLNIQTVCLPFF